MFDRLWAGIDLARSSWRVLLTDKKLLFFPVMSGIACLLVLATFVTPFLFHTEWLGVLDANNGVRADASPSPWIWLVLFAYYFCSYFVVIFFNAALISCALIRFNGGTPTLADGLAAAGSRLPQILAWALVSATVGLLLKAIENAHEKAGAFVSAILGTAWSIITYFVVPVLVVERVGPFQAISRSLSILRRTWGESLVGNMGLNLFLFLLLLPAIIVGLLGGLLYTAVPIAGIAVLALAGVYLLVWLAVGPALNGIFVTAMYQYAANGEVPHGFDRHAMEQAFSSRR